MFLIAPNSLDTFVSLYRPLTMNAQGHKIIHEPYDVVREGRVNWRESDAGVDVAI